MLAQRELELYTPPTRSLATLRRDVAAVLLRCPCQGTQQRILLAVNEIIANVLRHSKPVPTDIQVDFVGHDDKVYCVIRDNGGAFVDFRTEWDKAEKADRSGLPCSQGLRLVRSLWPEAFYIKRSEAFPYNSFILPLTLMGIWHLPEYFRPDAKTDFQELVAPLAIEKLI